MKKRLISSLMILALILTTLCFGTIGASATDQTATVRVGDQTYTAGVGEYIEYRIAFRYSGEKLATAQIELPVDFTAFSGYAQEDIAAHLDQIAPATADDSVVLRTDGSSTIGIRGYVMNFAGTSGYSFTTETTVMSMILCVEKAGTYDLTAKVRYVDDIAGNTVIDSQYQRRDDRFTYTESVREAILATPALSAQTDAGGVRISWDSVPGATLYRVYTKSGSGWTKLADTRDNTYLHTGLAGGARNTYTVRCLSKDGKRFISDYDHTGKTAVYYPAPILRLSNAVDDVSIKWDATAGARKYRVYIKKNGSWTKLTDTTATSAVDQSVVSGNTYTYTIRSMDENGKHLSWYYPEGFSIDYVNAPDFKLSAAANGVKISWSAVAGAAKYRVYRDTADGWKKIADTAETSYLDTAAASDKTHTYTVRCITADGKSFQSAYRSGKSIKFYAAPKPRLSNDEDGVSIQWDAIPGAAQYRVYVRKNGSWTKVVDTASTSALDKNVASGSEYTYTIRAMDKKGNHLSYYYTDGVTIRYVQAPTFSLSKTAEGVKISWNAVSGADRYRVFIKNASGSWTRLVDVTGATSYEDRNVTSDKSYTYTVRCVSDDGSSYISDYRAGKSVKFYAAPKPTLSNTSKGVSLKWNAVTGAAKYRIYIKTASGWTKLADTTSTSYVHTAAVNGTKYTYTIRAMDSKGNHLSWYYPDGFSITCRR